MEAVNPPCNMLRNFVFIYIFIGCCFGRFINFEPGYEYLYKYQSKIEVKDLGTFVVKSKISYTNIQDLAEGQELLLRVYIFQFHPENDKGVQGHDFDLSKWFSFVITPHGEIIRVYHARQDEDEVVAIKKGLASFLEGKLHDEDEIPGETTQQGWTYHTVELGHEGQHNATYVVVPTSEGRAFHKTRHSHPVQHFKANYSKIMHYNDKLGTLHKVLVEEDFVAPFSTKPGFDPHYAMRKVEAVNEFSDEVYPDMSALSKGELEFLQRKELHIVVKKPADKHIQNTSIHIDKVERTKSPVSFRQAQTDIEGNLTCMQQNNVKGSSDLTTCYMNIVSILASLQDHQLSDMAEYYFSKHRAISLHDKTSREAIMDAFGALCSDHAQELLVNYILLAPNPSHSLVKRLFIHFIAMDTAPIELFVTTLENICFHPEKFPEKLFVEDTYHRALLTMGSIAKKLSEFGDVERAHRDVDRIHDMLGLHDPWSYRQRKETMSEKESILDEHHKVVLLETLGNARLDTSFEYIVSHINATNAPWVKRAGIHALRHYHHEQAAEVLLMSAVHDDDANVRYEALLQYQAHPEARIISPVNTRSSGNTTLVADPYLSGISDVVLHHRSKRSLFDGISFDLVAPGVDFMKMIGSTTLGASFGVVMDNGLHAQIAPLSGGAQLNVHDEVYARIHLGFIKKNVDFFLSRTCFKGRAEYNLNILQEYNPDEIIKKAKQFGAMITNIISSIKKGIDLFRSIINGDIEFDETIKEFVAAFEEMPSKVMGLRKKAFQVMSRFGSIDEKELPPFLQPLKRLVQKVTTLFNNIKTDVMGFYNAVMETITIVMPQALKSIYRAIHDIIDGFVGLGKDPKQAIAAIGKGVTSIYISIMQLLDAKNRTQEACFFLKDEKPYWWDITSEYAIVSSMAEEAVRALTSGGATWIAETIASEDPVAKFTKGKMTMNQLKEEVLTELKSIIDDLLEPFHSLTGIADRFIELYQTIFGLVSDIKKVHTALKEGVQLARSTIDQIFGSKCHKLFPRMTRMPGGGCNAKGFYPSALMSGDPEYTDQGVDIIVEEGNDIVAPFSGVIKLTDNANEVVIETSGGSLQDIMVILINVAAIDTAPRVAAGQVIGTATQSPCAGNNHIHMSMKKGDDYIDPTRFLEPRLPIMPRWIQECDDYKLVFKFETISVGKIVGTHGRQEKDTSPKVENADITKPESLNPELEPGMEVEEMKESPTSMFSKLKSKPLPDDFDDKEPENGGNSLSAEKSSQKNGLGSFLKSPRNFLEKISFRSFKLGSIIEFIDYIKLNNTKDGLAKLMKTVKAIIDNKPCYNPHQMTDDALKMTLKERGLDASGTTDQMINRLLQADNQCPLLSLTMPKNLYCTFDSLCLGVECCLNMKLFMFLKTFKAYARFDPCDLEFHIGIEDWHKTLSFDQSFDAFENEMSTGIQLNHVGGVELLIRYSVEKSDKEIVASFEVGFCKIDDKTNCLPFVKMLDDAVLPLPVCYPNGTIKWPDVNFAEYFSKENVARRLKESTKELMKETIKLALKKMLQELGLPEDILESTPPCPYPESMTDTFLNTALEKRGLSTAGSRSDRELRYRQYDFSCSSNGKDITLPTITDDKLRKHLYYSITEDCLQIDACVDFTIQKFEYTKALRSYINLDPCNFLLTVSFEMWSKTFILINFKWGVEKVITVSDQVQIRFTIDKDDDAKVFLVDFWWKVCFAASNCVIDVQLFKQQKIPIPLCSENFTLPGGSISWLASALGGSLTEEAFGLVLKEVGLDKFLLDDSCHIEPPVEVCPWNLKLVEHLPTKLQKSVMCELPDNCYGAKCCVNVDIKIPFSELHIQKSIPVWFIMEPCDFIIHIGLGSFQHTEQLLKYDWDKRNVLKLGNGDPAPVNIEYSIAKTSDDLGFLVDFNFMICLPVGGDTLCIPEGGLKLMDEEEIKGCDAREIIKFKDLSLASWLEDKGIDAKDQLGSAGVKLLLQELGIAEYLLDSPCDPEHKPYTPSIAGINNQCPLSFLKMQRLPKQLKCHIPEKCTAIDCCLSVEFLHLTFNAFIDIDTCNYIVAGCVEKLCFNISLFGYEWGKKERVTLRDIIRLEFSIKKPSDKKIFIIDMSISACFENNKPCLLTIPVFKSTEVPQPICDLSSTIELAEFSFSSWASSLNIKELDLTKKLSSVVVNLLLEQLGIDVWLKSPSCNRATDKYKLAENNWQNNCPKSLNLPDLTGPVTCFIPDHCGGVDCCLDVNFLGVSLNAYLYIDTCNYIISGGIENLKFHYIFLDYKWGTDEEFNLQEVIKIRFKIDKLDEKKEFQVDLSFAVCLENGEDCQFKVEIFHQTKIPQAVCDWSIDFDFSLSEWMSEKGRDVHKSLPDSLIAVLLEELGLNDFVEDPSCDRQHLPYTMDGWTNDCPSDIVLPQLNGPVSCHIPQMCSAIDCCVYISIIRRSVHMFLTIDTCNYVLILGIEKLNFTIPFPDNKWGKEQSFTLKGIFYIKFSIFNLDMENFGLTMNILACFEKNNCLFDIPILQQTKLPKIVCDTADSKIPNFSLTEWLSQLGLTDAADMTQLQQDMLLQHLGLMEYMSSDECSLTVEPYQSPGTWNDQCGQLNTENIGSDLSCYIPSDCSAVHCCVDVSVVGHFLEAVFHLDMCQLQLNIQLGKLRISYSLLNYKYETKEDIRIHGIYRMIFMITNVPSRGMFTVDLKLQVCFEADASSTCQTDTNLFLNMDLPYPNCPQDETNVFTDGLTFDLWKQPACELPTTHTTDCASLREPLLPQFARDNCRLDADCAGIVCCVLLDMFAGYKKVWFTLKLDMCDDTSSDIFIGIERKMSEKSGVTDAGSQHFHIGRLFSLNYEVVDGFPANSFKVTASFKACGLLSEDGGCSVSEFLHGTILGDCGGAVKRRKRGIDGIEASTMIVGIKLLKGKDASEEEINTFIKQWQIKEKDEKEKNWEGAESDPGDKTIGYRTAVDSLGSSDPTTLTFSDHSSLDGSVTIQGSDAIGKMLGTVQDIAGRANQIFVVGKGLSPVGTKLLSEKLANMTIRDLEAMLDLKNLDPDLVLKFTLELRDLCRALYSELIEVLFSGALIDEFKSFDLTLTGSFGFPQTNIKLFKFTHYFLIGGVPMTFAFGADGYYGMDFTVGVNILNMEAFTGVIPYAGLTCYGQLSVGVCLTASLRLEGRLLDLRFPTKAEITFSKFPLDVRLIMDLKLIPISVKLKALVTLKVNLLFKTIRITILKKTLYSYSAPTITKRMVDTRKKEEDISPPEFKEFTDKAKSRRKRSTQQCSVRQIPNKDITEPEFEISFQAEDDRSQVTLVLNVGTSPGGRDVLTKQELGGPLTIIKTILRPTGVPLYMTVIGTNDAGTSSSINCVLPSFDITLPSGRFTTAFSMTSNSHVLIASLLAFEDSILTGSRVAVGFGMEIYADQIVHWHNVDLAERITDLTSQTNSPLEHFTQGKNGRLIGTVFDKKNGVMVVDDCAEKCLEYGEKKCLSFNYDYGTDTTCELLDVIEGHDFNIAESGLFSHFERLGIGHAVKFKFEDVSLTHNGLYFFNMELKNYLNYTNIISSEGILADFTPPEPGLIRNGKFDYTEIIDCLDVIPDDRRDWEKRCVDVDKTIHNHRVIIDGHGSLTVFNGLESMVDLLYTRANKQVTANWDGFHDNETGIFGYSLAVGHEVCEDVIHQHYDPHKHLLDESQWTHYAIIYPISEPYQILDDGKKYVTVKALNKVQYGGPLSTSVCHSTPFIVDNSPPFMHEIFNIQYDETTFELFVEYSASDPQSNVDHVDLCLGFTTRSCDVLDFVPYPYGNNITHITSNLPNGRPIWIMLRAVNYVDLRTIKVSDQYIILDLTPPEAGTLYDGSLSQQDIQFTKENKLICSNWEDFYDSESGISYYEVGVGSAHDVTDIVELIRFDHRVHDACISLEENNYLEHGNTYYNILYAFNGGHMQLNVSVSSNGVMVDLTKPEFGEIVDGNDPDFIDIQFTAAVATVAVQWRNYRDPESLIQQYNVKVMRAENLSEDFEELKDWTSFNNKTEDITWRNFHLHHRDQIRVVLQTVNGALNQIESITDGLVVDLTPAKLIHLDDGLIENSDVEYQSHADSLSANFQFVDEESGLDHFKFQVFQHLQGSKHQIHPVLGSWEEVTDPTLTVYTQRSLSLISGALYSMRVGVVNQAGFVAVYDTNGVIVDVTPPKMHWIQVSALAGEEEKVDGYVWQSDKEGIKAMWSASDAQSGIKAFSIAVGTSAGGIDILPWTDVGMDLDRYISNLELHLTDLNSDPKTPVFYVSVKAENGAGMFSDPMTSTPIIVVSDDKPGIAIDGADGSENPNSEELGTDINFQADTNTVTVQFRGFESELHGVMSYEWAVGLKSEGESVQPFMKAEIVHIEEELVAGNGVTSSGYAQAVLPLVSGQKYYTTLKAMTNGGNILEAVTDGFTVDTTQPDIILDSVSGEVSPNLTVAGSMLYQSFTDILSAQWHYSDSESSIQIAWSSVGTTPGGQEVWEAQEVVISPSQTSSLEVRQTQPDTTGKPNIFNIWARNKAGKTGKLSSASVIVDTTEPLQGSLVCPSVVVSQSAVKCSWYGFFDKESYIEKFLFTVGSRAGFSDILNLVELPGYRTKYTIQGLELNFKHGDKYYVMVTAVNAVGMSSYAVSEAINIDNTPPEVGNVVELPSENRIVIGDDAATVALNNHLCQSDEDCQALDADCQESMSTVAVAWQPFVDEESGIKSYELAVGTISGGGQIKAFFKVPTDQTNYVITGLVLSGLKKIYVTVKGINGAGLTSVSMSDGIYLSYLSQGLPPLSQVGIWDVMETKIGDIDFQTDQTTIKAEWDVSGDPCPAIKYEWAIERIDGLRVQDFVDTEGKTSAENVKLNMKNKERYYSLLRVTNAQGYTYTLRSDGVTILKDPIRPGQVFVGDLKGFDLDFQPSQHIVSANWNGFGAEGYQEQAGVITGNSGIQTDAEESNQEIVYYEVALGTDRRFTKSRDDVVPFTDVGLNETVTFNNLDLIPTTATYYFTVRAHSPSSSVAEVTSTGFSVGYNRGVSGGNIRMNDFVKSATTVGVQWYGFTSSVDLLLNYVALSDNTEADGTDCKLYVHDVKAFNEVKTALFNVFDVTNVGRDTYMQITNLDLTQGSTYYAWVIVTDQAGECQMVYHQFTVDLSPPYDGHFRTGPYYDMAVTYTETKKFIGVWWENYKDLESGIRSYEVSLRKVTSCSEDDGTETLVVDWITLDDIYTSYTFVGLDIQAQTPHYVYLRVVNWSGLEITEKSSPVLYDPSTPTAGRVIDGDSFMDDVVWSGTQHTVKGIILHLAEPTGPSCPSRSISVYDDPGWKSVVQKGFLDPDGIEWKLQHRAENVHKKKEGDIEEVSIKISRDTKSENFFTGAYMQTADFVNDGTYQVTVKAAGGEGKAVTGIMFWDGPNDGIAIFNNVPDKERILDACTCCLEIPVIDCLCDCTDYLKTKQYYNKLKEDASETSTEATSNQSHRDQDGVERQGNPWIVYDPSIHTDVSEQIPINTSTPLAQRSCGIQLYTGKESKLVTWCRVFDDALPPQVTIVPLLFDPSEDYHQYKIVLTSQYEEISAPTKCLTVFIDEGQMTEICGIPNLLLTTKLVFHVWHKYNIVPETTNKFSIWTTLASFKDLIMPPEVSALCRNGNPFRGGTNPIILYEAGIGLERGQANVVDFRKVISPCLPCTSGCDFHGCDDSCEADNPTLFTFELDDLDLDVINPNTNDTCIYYLTVKAVLASGASVTASSDGFYIDITPPKFDLDAMMYIDVTQGEFEPIHFQASNSTIKSIWKCDDPESGIKNYWWAIGTTEGGMQLQTFQSTGEDPTGTNDGFLNILKHNTKYYVSVICINGAGQRSLFNDAQGVMALLDPPLADDVETSVVGAEKFDLKVIPEDAIQSNNPRSLGVSWTVSEDKSIQRYEVCFGSSQNLMGDIFPCTWVGYNTSGEMMIKNGKLMIGGTVVWHLSELKVPDVDYAEDVEQDDNAFNMEVGRTIFVKMRLCNNANLCVIREASRVVIMDNKTQMATSENGRKLELTVTLPDSKRRLTTPDLIMQTPDGLLQGQSIMMNTLTQSELETEYRSGASTEFVPYIANPAATLYRTDRWLRKRIQFALHFFTVVSVGQLELPGPLEVTFPSYIPDSYDDTSMTVLIHWNPVARKWELTSKTCSSEEETESLTVKVCNTWKALEKPVAELPLRKRRAAITDPPQPDSSYFASQTQFGLAVISRKMPNSPPYFTSRADIIMNEDEALTYMMQADDLEDDPVLFSLDAGYKGPTLGEISLSSSGFLMYTTCADCYGKEVIPVTLSDNPVGITAASSGVTLTIHIQSVADSPTIFLTRMGSNFLHADPTQPVTIMIEQQSHANPDPEGYELLLGAYDVDTPDNLTIFTDGPLNGKWQIGDTNTDIPDITNCSSSKMTYSFPCEELVLPHPASELTWNYVTLRYDQTFLYHGVDTVQMYVEDSSGGMTDVITLNFAVLEFLCENGGSCTSPDGVTYTCQDIRRAESFDKYYNCTCLPGFVGQHCEIDFDECSSSPCDLKYICVDGINHYSCECPPHNMDCESWPLWAILLLTGGLVVVVVVISILIYKIQRKQKKTKTARRSKYQSSNLNRGFVEDEVKPYGSAPAPPRCDYPEEPNADEVKPYGSAPAPPRCDYPEEPNAVEVKPYGSAPTPPRCDYPQEPNQASIFYSGKPFVDPTMSLDKQRRLNSFPQVFNYVEDTTVPLNRRGLSNHDADYFITPVEDYPHRIHHSDPEEMSSFYCDPAKKPNMFLK